MAKHTLHTCFMYVNSHQTKRTQCTHGSREQKKEEDPGVLLTNDRAAWRRMHVRGSQESKSETQGTL